MSRIKNTNYFTVHGWMINDLGLSSNELLIYSIIYGFSQDGSSEFTGSMNYLAEFINSTRPTINKCLKSLTDKGFLIKTDRNIGNQNLPTYRIVDLDLTGCKVSLQGSKDFLHPPCKDSLHNINTINNNIDSGSEVAANFQSKNYPLWTKEDFKASIEHERDKRKADPEKINFSSTMLGEFFNYWIAPTKSGKMFFATQDKWSTMQRLVTWQKKS